MSARSRRALAAAALSLLSAAGVLSGCSSSGAGTTHGTLTVVPAASREKAVTVAGTTLDGTALDVVAYRGRVVVVNVWGSWCGPCRKEAADLQSASTALTSSGVQFVGIDTNDDAASARAYVARFKVTYPSIVDEGGRVLLGLRGAVSPSAVPTTLVLDRQGRIAARVTSTVDAKTIEGLVQDVLAEKSS